MSLGISFFGGGGGGGGVLKVADAAARLALTPSDGLIVIQLDTDELWEYDGGTAAWVSIGGTSPTFVDVTITSSIEFQDPGVGTNVIVMQAPSPLAANWTFTLPPDVGTVDYVLRTDGTGVATWAQVSLTAGVTGVLPLANGGTNKNMTATNGGIVWTDADSMEVTAAGSAGQILQSAGAASPVWTTAVYPATTTVNEILYSSAANTIAGLATVNSAALVTTSGGVPGFAAGANGQVLKGVTGGTPLFGAVDITTDITGVLPIANGGTNKNLTLAAGGLIYSDADSFEVSAVGTTGQALISGGTGAPTWYAPTAGSVLFAGTGGILAEDNSNFFWDDTNNRLGIGIATPQNKVHIDNGTATNNFLQMTAGTTTGTNVADGLAFGVTSTGVVQFRQRENNNMSFFTNNGQVFLMHANGSVAVQNNTGTQLATNATAGFFYFPSSAGTPTGTPTTINGTVPTEIDTTNNLFYYYSNSKWRTAGGYVAQNTRQTGLSMSAATTITPAIGSDTTCFVVGNGGPVTITAGTPITTTAMQIGQELKIIGTSDTDTVTFDSGNNLVLNGSVTLAKDQVITLIYAGSDGTNSAWIEKSRSS